MSFRRDLYAMSGFCNRGTYYCMYNAQDASFVGGLLRHVGFDAVTVDCPNDFCATLRGNRLETDAGYAMVAAALVSLALLNDTLKGLTPTCADIQY